MLELMNVLAGVVWIALIIILCGVTLLMLPFIRVKRGKKRDIELEEWVSSIHESSCDDKE